MDFDLNPADFQYCLWISIGLYKFCLTGFGLDLIILIDFFTTFSSVSEL